MYWKRCIMHGWKILKVFTRFEDFLDSHMVIREAFRVSYRRFGHNEMDEPMFMQPLMYKQVHVLKKYSDKLLADGTVTLQEFEVSCRRFGHNEMDEPMFMQPLMYKQVHVLKKFSDKLLADGTVTLQEFEEEISKYDRICEEAEDETIGQKMRQFFITGTGLTRLGQDTNRRTCVPMNHLWENQAPYTVCNSSLSEYGVLLIVFSPKSLMRHPEVRSNFDEITTGTRFRQMIPKEGPAAQNPDKEKRVIFCPGKVYYELAKERKQQDLENKVAVCRLEQFCLIFLDIPVPFVKNETAKYSNAELVWCQEEHKNMGYYDYSKPRFLTVLQNSRPVWIVALEL
ncbi:UNVERIFIED_CONTAM: hypothetical protein FKN15_058672 [Acipenser sinensis]